MLKGSARVAWLLAGFGSIAAAQTPAPIAPSAPTAPSAPSAPVAPLPPAVAGAVPAAPASPTAPRAETARPAPAPFARASEARQGVARLERGGKTLGLGAVLRSDGRILTALSPLGHGNFIQARFADGSALAVRVVASDRLWDLALLAPEGGHWTEGLRPSVLEPPAAGAPLYRFRSRAARLEESALSVAGRQAVLGRDGATLSDVLLLSSRFGEDELGSPLFDERGDVAAIVVQACAPGAQGCQLSAFGAPVSALKQFLKQAPAREPLPAAWVGLRGVAAHEGVVAGVRIVAVDAGSPAERAGLRGSRGPSDDGGASGDLIVAVEDAPVTTPEEMRDAINRFALGGAPAPQQAPGASGGAASGERAVRLLVFGSGKFREVLLPLRPPRPMPATEPAAPSTAPAPGSPPVPTPAPSAAPQG
jgi:serine protease Do